MVVDQGVASGHRGSKRPRAKAREERIVARDTIIVSSYSPERSTKVRKMQLQPFAQILIVLLLWLYDETNETGSSVERLA